jgi:protein-L-isoaspartate(D-aspartate) O-methyltransferase
MVSPSPWNEHPRSSLSVCTEDDTRRAAMIDPAYLRERMVDIQLARRGIRDSRVLEAMRQVPREQFVQRGFEGHAYDDCALPIFNGQTISQPYIVALMTEAAELKSTDIVLEVGTGSGYAAAIASRLARTVHTIERHEALATIAARKLAILGYKNIAVHLGDGTRGLPNEAPFDAIVVAASGPAVPETLKSQLAVGGRLVIPVGEREGEQSLLRVTRRSEVNYEEHALGEVLSFR